MGNETEESDGFYRLQPVVIAHDVGRRVWDADWWAGSNIMTQYVDWAFRLPSYGLVGGLLQNRVQFVKVIGLLDKQQNLEVER
ncbi:hypothetical protein L484_018425 [Morus notabilis]|uniref:Uncharacterized protein n=1 Tax=Morus notabilis TaxID=981085 RepID=W9QDA7_9ROSA|nr:hypothetical protein L484_018425 [Morus notabilis]